MKKVSIRGGARKGAGRKKLFKGKTKRITITIPERNESKIRKDIDKLLDKYRVS